jgi:hypothetical protein
VPRCWVAEAYGRHGSAALTTCAGIGGFLLALPNNLAELMMRGRRLTPNHFDDERCWAVCFADDGEPLEKSLTASEAMRRSAEINVQVRRKGGRRVDVREIHDHGD